MENLELIVQRIKNNEIVEVTKADIFNILKSVRTEVDLKNLPEFDQEVELYKNYLKGVEVLDFNSICQFLINLEQGRFIYNREISCLGYIAFKLYQKEFLDYTGTIKDPVLISNLTEFFEIKELLDLGQKTMNLLVKFEVLRKCMFYKYEEIGDSEVDLLVCIIVDFSKDIDLWNKFIKFYLAYAKNLQLFKALGKSLIYLNDVLIDIIINELKNFISFYPDKKKFFNEFVFSIENKVLLQKVVKKLYKKWKEFLESKACFGKLQLTNLIDIVIFYVTNLVDKEKRQKMIDKILFNINEVENFWFENYSEEQKFFYKNLTLLFVYSFDLNYRIKEIKQIFDYYKELEERNVASEKSVFGLFEEYVFKSEDLRGL